MGESNVGSRPGIHPRPGIMKLPMFALVFVQVLLLTLMACSCGGTDSTPAAARDAGPHKVYTPRDLAVRVDVLPNVFPNGVDLDSTGNLEVAILSLIDFDARNVDVTTVRLSSWDDAA